VTYNFDADRWFENQRALLEGRRARGELDERGFAAAMEELERRYDKVTARLDGPFELPR